MLARVCWIHLSQVPSSLIEGIGLGFWMGESHHATGYAAGLSSPAAHDPERLGIGPINEVSHDSPLAFYRVFLARMTATRTMTFQNQSNMSLVRSRQL